MEFIDLKSQLALMRTNIDLRIKTVLDHGKFIMGPEVFELEETLAEYVGVKHCISCANGTDALQLSLMALGIGKGDIVFTTAFSFFATAEVIPLVGAVPYFADIDINTYNLCPKSLETAIIKAQSSMQGTPKAVIAVDMFGLPANYHEIQKICNKYSLKLIEDGAQGFGGKIGNRRVGSFGDIATTSFFPAKPLGCYGDGGAIFTNNDDLANVCKSLRVHGKGSHKYENIHIGLNSRLDTLQAAILLAKFSDLDREIEARQNVFDHYKSTLESVFEFQVIPLSFKSAWAQITLRCKNTKRDMVIEKLNQNAIPANIYYPSTLPEAKAFNRQIFYSEDYGYALAASQTVFSIPCHAFLDRSEINHVVDVLGNIESDKV
jgi:UDP-2-acetamido-2-deoxy-ribo-hexuluronate aminotransferase